MCALVNGKGMRLTDVACVFIDGAPRPGLSANAIDPESIEAVEMYASNAERSGTVATRWPRNQPCGDTGLPAGYKTRSADPMGGRQANSEVVHWIVIWLKH